MFPDPFDDGMSGRLSVAALDVELIEQGLEDQRCQECHPCLQQVDESRVGAELFEDLFGKTSLKEPCTVLFSWREEDSPKAVVYCAEVGWAPVCWDRVRWPKESTLGCVVCIGVDDGELSYLEFAWYPHGLAQCNTMSMRA